jgi:hypothetical protein
MRQALALIGLCCAVTACGSAGKAVTPTRESADASGATQAIAAWCSERQAEVAPAELAVIRGQEQRNRARFAAMLAKMDEDSDMYAVAQEAAEAAIAEEGLMFSLPLPAEAHELAGRLQALPADSAARAWGETLAGYRAALARIDRLLKQSPPDQAALEDEGKKLESTYGKPDALLSQAKQAGVAPCGQMILRPDEERLYAAIAVSGIAGASEVDGMVGALRKQEPWLMVRALPDACALPAIGDPAAGEPISSHTIGIWKDATGTVGVTVVDGFEHGGTLAHSASGEIWTTFTVESSDAGELRRVEPCPR